jgi:hypothetical protein
MNLKTEPLRILYGTAVLLVAVYGPCAIYLGTQGHTAQASLLTGIGTALAGLLGVEGKRAVTDSPATKENQAAVLSAVAAPVLAQATQETPAPAGLTLAEQADAALTAIEKP